MGAGGISAPPSILGTAVMTRKGGGDPSTTFTQDSGKDRIALITVWNYGHTDQSAVDHNSVTYGGAAATMILNDQFNSGTDRKWHQSYWVVYEANLPANGAITVSCDTIGTCLASAISVSMVQSVAQSVQSSNDVHSTSASSLLTTLNPTTLDQSLIVASMFTRNTSQITSGAGQTELIDVAGTYMRLSTSWKLGTGATSTMRGTSSSANICSYQALAFLPA